MKNARDIIIRPIITERSTTESQKNKYTFEVSRDANKIEIAQAVEEIYGVDVMGVNTLNMKGKLRRTGRFEGRRKNWKKAVVTLTPESKPIEFFEGV